MSKWLTGILQVTVQREGVAEPRATVSVSPSNHAPQQTRDDGMAFFDLLTGSYQVSVTSADGEWTASKTVKMTAEEGTLVDLALQHTKGGGGGQTTDSETVDMRYLVSDVDTGQPIGSATVTLAGQSIANNGSGIFKKVAKGRQSYTATAPDYDPVSGQHEVNDNEGRNLDLVLVAKSSISESGTLILNVVDQKTGLPVEDAVVSLFHTDSTVSMSQSASVPLHLRTGIWTYTLSAEGYMTSAPNSVQIKPNETLSFSPKLQSSDDSTTKV